MNDVAKNDWTCRDFASLARRIESITHQELELLSSGNDATGTLSRCLRKGDTGDNYGDPLMADDEWETCMPVFRAHRNIKKKPFGDDAVDTTGRSLEFCRGDPNSSFRKEGVCPVSGSVRPGSHLPFRFYGHKDGRKQRKSEIWFTDTSAPLSLENKGCFSMLGKTGNLTKVCIPEHRLHGYVSDCFMTDDHRVRCLPKWIGLGLHKSGTTALFDFVQDNFPQVRNGKELRFWNPSRSANGGRKGPAKCRFPDMECYLPKNLNNNSFYADMTVPLTFHIHSSLFVEQAYPDARFLVTVRDPIDVMWSHAHFSRLFESYSQLENSIIAGLDWMVACQENSDWNKHTGAAWDPACSFKTETVASHAKKSNNTNLATGLQVIRDGLFSDTLHPWLARFNLEQFLFIPSHKLKNPSSSDEIRDHVSKLLGVPPLQQEVKYASSNSQTTEGKYGQGMRGALPHVAALLERFFLPEKMRISIQTGIPIEDLFPIRNQTTPCWSISS